MFERKSLYKQSTDRTTLQKTARGEYLQFLYKKGATVFNNMITMYRVCLRDGCHLQHVHLYDVIILRTIIMIVNMYFLVLCCIVLYNLFNDVDRNSEH
jgi:hypothetical protein